MTAVVLYFVACLVLTGWLVYLAVVVAQHVGAWPF